MKTRWLCTALGALALTLASVGAEARPWVGVSVGIPLPGIVVAPAPVYPGPAVYPGPYVYGPPYIGPVYGYAGWYHGYPGGWRGPAHAYYPAHGGGHWTR